MCERKPVFGGIGMKKLIAMLLLLCMLLPMEAMAAGKVIYRGEITDRYPNSYTRVYSKMDKNSKSLVALDPGSPVNITAVHPGYVEVVLSSGKTGYILRNRVDVTETVDPTTTPPYPVIYFPYYVEIDRTVEVKAEKNADSETLSLLTAGARVAVLGCEDGWIKLVHKRQYGYINSNEVSAILSVAPDAASAEKGETLAVFNSFYSDDKDRINNLEVACNFISKTLQPGESMNFNDTVGPFSAANGYLKAFVLKKPSTSDEGEQDSEGYGGGSCQVSSSLWDTLMQLDGITILMRKPHGANGIAYLPHGMDASSGRDDLNLIFRNDYDFPIRIDAACHDLCLFIAIYKGE